MVLNLCRVKLVAIFKIEQSSRARAVLQAFRVRLFVRTEPETKPPVGYRYIYIYADTDQLRVHPFCRHATVTCYGQGHNGPLKDQWCCFMPVYVYVFSARRFPLPTNIYIYIYNIRFPSGKCLREWRKDETQTSNIR